jgi:[acyl-carrier-protein] S-malonyltransferase
MTALIGGDPQEVRAAIEAAGATAANVNGAGQIVAAGTLEQLAALAAQPPARARVVPLSVAGAFHTAHMAPAVDVLAGYAAAIDVHDAQTRLLSNADGTVVHDGREVLDRLVRQVAAPVRWDLCMQTLADLEATAVIELPPAGTLTGLIRRTLPGVQTLALKTPDDLPAARELVARHGTPTDLAATPSWRVVVSPAAGTFARADTARDEQLAPGATVGAVLTRRERVSVVAPHGGTVIEWLAEDGDPVAPGQPLLRLHPTSATS